MIKKAGVTVIILVLGIGVLLNIDFARTYLTQQYKRIMSDTGFEFECLSIELPKHWVINKFGESAVHLERMDPKGGQSFFVGVFPMQDSSILNRESVKKIGELELLGVDFYELDSGENSLDAKQILPYKNYRVLLMGKDFRGNQAYIGELFSESNSTNLCNNGINTVRND